MVEWLFYSSDSNAVLLRAALWKLAICMIALWLITYWLWWLDKRLGIDFRRHVWPNMRDKPDLYMAARILGACILVGLVMSA